MLIRVNLTSNPGNDSNPKQPTISIYQLIEGEYQVRQFRGSDRIQSPAFPGLNLTAEQIFRAGEAL